MTDLILFETGGNGKILLERTASSGCKTFAQFAEREKCTCLKIRKRKRKNWRVFFWNDPLPVSLAVRKGKKIRLENSRKIATDDLIFLFESEANVANGERFSAKDNLSEFASFLGIDTVFRLINGDVFVMNRLTKNTLATAKIILLTLALCKKTCEVSLLLLNHGEDFTLTLTTEYSEKDSPFLQTVLAITDLPFELQSDGKIKIDCTKLEEDPSLVGMKVGEDMIAKEEFITT